MYFRSCHLHALYCPAYFFGRESKSDENLTYSLLALSRGEIQQAVIYWGLLRVLPSYCSIKAKMQVFAPKWRRNPIPPQLCARYIIMHTAKQSISEICMYSLVGISQPGPADLVWVAKVWNEEGERMKHPFPNLKAMGNFGTTLLITAQAKCLTMTETRTVGGLSFVDFMGLNQLAFELCVEWAAPRNMIAARVVNPVKSASYIVSSPSPSGMAGGTKHSR